MNDHHYTQKNLPLYVSGDLDDTGKARVTAHIAVCSECRSAGQQHRALLGMLSDEAVAAPRRPMPAVWRRLLTTAAALAVFFAGYLTARQADERQPDQTAAQPHRSYDRYVASSSRASGMFRVLAAVARREEPR